MEFRIKCIGRTAFIPQIKGMIFWSYLIKDENKIMSPFSTSWTTYQTYTDLRAAESVIDDYKQRCEREINKTTIKYEYY